MSRTDPYAANVIPQTRTIVLKKQSATTACDGHLLAVLAPGRVEHDRIVCGPMPHVGCQRCRVKRDERFGDRRS